MNVLLLGVNGGLTDTATVLLTVGEAPHGVIAVLEATPAGGGAPLSVSFDASASLPGTGETITGYDFDFDGDGSVDQSGASPSKRADCTSAVRPKPTDRGRET